MIRASAMGSAMVAKADESSMRGQLAGSPRAARRFSG
jgi:hypothetical protein